MNTCAYGFFLLRFLDVEFVGLFEHISFLLCTFEDDFYMNMVCLLRFMIRGLYYRCQ